MRTKEAEEFAAIAGQLCRWYGRSARTLPWRANREPYRVWVSEIMLQQTRVETAGPYFKRFLAKFPTVHTLAAAPLDAVLKTWEGLGYYSRARNMHLAAAEIVNRGGLIPSDVQQLLALPGIGRYTAGAIASIAFGRDEPVLDGNVTRVLCRLFAIAGNPKSPRIARRLWRVAGELLPRGRAGEFNQAVMDLGATICTPRGPRCGDCPLRRHCRALAAGRQEKLPTSIKKRALPHHTIVAGVIVKGRRLLIDRRAACGLLGGLWEFPGGKVEPGETHVEALQREIREEVGLEAVVGEKIGVVRHAYSHFKITMHVYRCRWQSGVARAIGCDKVKWVLPDGLADYAFPAATNRIIAAGGIAAG